MELIYKTISGKLDPGMSEYYVYFLLSTKDSVNEKPVSVSVTLDPVCEATKLTGDVTVRGLVPGPSVKKYGVCLQKALFGINEPQVGQSL